MDSLENVQGEQFYEGHIPDSVWLEVFSQLRLCDLLRCRTVCLRWQRIARDHSLWKRIKWDEAIDKNIPLRELIPFLSKRTVKLELTFSSARRPKSYTFPTSFLYSVRLNCPNLRQLSIRGAVIDYSSTKLLDHIPPNLTHLSLEDLLIENLREPKSYLGSPLAKIHKRLPKLRSLDIRGTASWFGAFELEHVLRFRQKNPLVLTLPSGLSTVVSLKSLGEIGRRERTKAIQLLKTGGTIP